MRSYFDPQPRKPFYRRFWFLSLLFGMLAIAGAGVFGYVVYLLPYKERAAEFDLAELEEMEQATLIYDRKGEVMGRIFIQNRDSVPLQDFPYHLVQAVIAAEDNRFYRHGGVDYIGMGRAFVKNWQASRITQGGSTLTMQLARNTFSLKERSYDRKMVEAFLSMRVERHLSKNKILELYLNRVYFGAGLYGAEAAARGYFGKSARDLSLPEAAMLAGLLKSPNNLSPWSNRRASIQSRDIVLGRMLELGMIEKESHRAAVAEDPDVKTRQPVGGHSYPLDYVRQQVIGLIGFEDAASDGFRVFTTIDSSLQSIAEQALSKHLAALEKREAYAHPTYADYENYLRRHQRESGADPPALPEYLQGAVLTLDNRTGAILAMVGGRDFKHSEFNRAILAKRPPGTAFKPLVFATAFEKGLFPGTLVEDSHMDNRQVMIGGTTGILGEWGVESPDNRYEGRIPARRALVASKNAATVRVGLLAGLEAVTELAVRSGISSELRQFPSTYLGSSEVSLEELATAFTLFPGGGVRPNKPFVIDRIEDQSGQVIFRETPGRTRVLRDSVAWEVHSCLSEALETGTADDATTLLGLKRFPAGGKTGTAYNFTDAWFLGYNSTLTTGVWVGFDKPGTIYRGAFSREVALPVWVELMNASLDAYPAGEIPRPDSLRRIEICGLSGLLSVDECTAGSDEETQGADRDKKSTFFEWADEKQVPPGLCHLHGGGEPPVLAEAALIPGQWPRAEAAVDLATVVPVEPKASTVIGEDPYRSLAAAQAAAEAAREAMGQEATEVRRAEPVRPFDKPSETPLIQLPPPPPLAF